MKLQRLRVVFYFFSISIFIAFFFLFTNKIFYLRFCSFSFIFFLSFLLFLYTLFYQKKKYYNFYLWICFSLLAASIIQIIPLGEDIISLDPFFIFNQFVFTSVLSVTFLMAPLFLDAKKSILPSFFIYLVFLVIYVIFTHSPVHLSYIVGKEGFLFVLGGYIVSSCVLVGAGLHFLAFRHRFHHASLVLLRNAIATLLISNLVFILFGSDIMVLNIQYAFNILFCLFVFEVLYSTIREKYIDLQTLLAHSINPSCEDLSNPLPTNTFCLDARIEETQLQSEFIRTTTHELRTPLLSLKESHHLLMNSWKTDKTDIQIQLDQITKRNISRLESLINNLLEYNKVENIPILKKFEEINPIIDQTVHDFQSLAEAKNLRIQLDLANNLPIALVNKEGINRIIDNLLSNAIKYTKNGFIRIHTEFIHPHIRIDIQDTGIGIPTDKIHLIFHPFVRIQHSEAPAEIGSGLGLSIAQKIAHVHGGEIIVESQLNKGSIFTVTIPVS